MTARDEAIEAMAQAPGLRVPIDTLRGALDAIPLGVLARLAIEQGGLEMVCYDPDNGDLYRYRGGGTVTGTAAIAIIVACLSLAIASILNSIVIERLESRIEQLEQQAETP